MIPSLRLAASLSLAAALAPNLVAQDLTITNVRIIGPDVSVIENGSIVIEGGRITSVIGGAPGRTAGQVIDAGGMTAMPGFIDGHRHINTGPNEADQMQALLEAGYTTVMSGGGPGPGNLTLREHIDTGQINGPRIIPTGSLRLGRGQTAETARQAIREMKEMGIDWTGEIALTPVPGPSAQ